MTLGRIATSLDWLERMLTALAGGILGMLTLLVAWQVVGRYVFDMGLFWADELTGVADDVGCFAWGNRLYLDRLPHATQPDHRPAPSHRTGMALDAHGRRGRVVCSRVFQRGDDPR